MKKVFALIFLLSFSCIFPKSLFETPWGKDSSLIAKSDKKETYSLSLIGKIVDKIISFHQNFLTQVDGPRSNFRPTSSRYMQLAIKRYGFFKGYIMGCDRLLRENEEDWIYPKIIIDNFEYKFDPARDDKHFR